MLDNENVLDDESSREEQNELLVNSLLSDFKGQRDSLILMIDDLEKVKSKLDILFPEQLDKRNVLWFQEKVKAVTELFKAILDIRKEIIKSIKDEMEFRRKSDSKRDGEFDDVDIRKLATRVEKLAKVNESLQTKKEQNNEVNIGS